MGLQQETDEDIQKPFRGCSVFRYRSVAARALRFLLPLPVVPKSLHAIQWVGQISREEAQRRRQLLLSSQPRWGLKIAYHDSGFAGRRRAVKMGRDG